MPAEMHVHRWRQILILVIWQPHDKTHEKVLTLKYNHTLIPKTTAVNAGMRG